MNKTSGYSLASKAMLVGLKVSAWGGQRLDRQETARVTAENHASADALKVTKDLVGPHLASLRASERAIRAEHRRLTLPWSDDATRLLPTAMWEDYRTKVGDLVDVHINKEIPDFIAAYETTVIPEARKRLGSLFRAEDFPSEIASKFNASIRYLPVPEAGDVRVALSEAEVEALRQEVTDATTEAFEAANKDILDRAMKPLTRLSEVLREYGPGKRLSSALLSNVAEIAELMPKLDISGNAEIAAIAAEINALAEENPTRLTNSKRRRETVSATADELVAKLAAIF